MTRPESGDDYEKIFTAGYLLHTDEKRVLAQTLGRELAGYRGEAALDIGPGSGEITAVLAEHAEELTALEPQAAFAKKLLERLPRAKILPSLAQDARFPPASFDLILCSHMLYYIPIEQWDGFLKKLLSWLKPGGRLYVALTAGDSDWFRSVSDLSKLLQMNPGFSFIAPEHFFPATGARRTIPYDATFEFRGAPKELEYFLVELELLTPYRLISERQKELVAGYVRERLTGSDRFRLKNRYLIGVWER